MNKATYLFISIVLLFFMFNCASKKRKIDLSGINKEKILNLYSFIFKPSSTSFTDRNELPLLKYGIRGLEGLQKILKKIDNKKDKEKYNKAFRYIFTEEKHLINISKSQRMFEELLENENIKAYAEYGLGWTNFYTKSDDFVYLKRAIRHFYNAVDLKPRFAEAHYMLATIYCFINLSVAFRHYKKAIAHGGDDELNIEEIFFEGIY